jgi:hypothetical protein
MLVCVIFLVGSFGAEGVIRKFTRLGDVQACPEA